ncbi:MAG: hypothetical protein ABI262_16800, partial [Microcoleus sp.]
TIPRIRAIAPNCRNFLILHRSESSSCASLSTYAPNSTLASRMQRLTGKPTAADKRESSQHPNIQISKYLNA